MIETDSYRLLFQFVSISNRNYNFRHGNGMYRYSNGDIYDGSWANGNQEGEGLLLYASGNRLEGEYSRFIEY